MGTVAAHPLFRSADMRPGARRPLAARFAAAATFAVLVSTGRAAAQHVEGRLGGGLGFFLSGGPGIGDSNGHKFGSVSVSVPGDDVRVRWIQGSLERTKDLPSDTQDNDLDYFGFDVVATRKWTGLPVDLAIGVARFEEAYHEGYPDRDLGGRVFVHRWGPHVSAMRSFPIVWHLDAFLELDVHLAPYRPRQYPMFLETGLSLRF